MKGAYIVKWSEIPVSERGELYEESIKISIQINDALKIILEIAGIFVAILTLIEYYKYYKIYKEEMSK